MGGLLWEGTSDFQEKYNQLRELIPDEGPVEMARTSNKALEKLRVAANVYYDLYNNGLCNTNGAQFFTVFGFRFNEIKACTKRRVFFGKPFDDVEDKIEKLIVEAWDEQFGEKKIWGQIVDAALDRDAGHVKQLLIKLELLNKFGG